MSAKGTTTYHLNCGRCLGVPMRTLSTNTLKVVAHEVLVSDKESLPNYTKRSFRYSMGVHKMHPHVITQQDSYVATYK